MQTMRTSNRVTFNRVQIFTVLSLAIACWFVTAFGHGQVLQSVAVTPSNSSVVVGGAQQFTAIGTYSDGSVQNLTGSVAWSSTNSAIASISGSGMVIGLSAGNTSIAANAGAVTGTTTLTVSTSGLAGWWKFSEGTGTTAADSSGSGNNAALANGIKWTAGQAGNAVSANGVNQYIGIPAVNLKGTKAVTWTAWVNRSYTTLPVSALLEDSANFNTSTTGFGFFPDDGDDCPTSSPLMTGVHGNVGFTLNCYVQPTSGVWHHIAAVYDKSQPAASVISLYFDGVLQTPKKTLSSARNTNSFGANPIYLFSRGGAQLFSSGTVDDLRIYGVALSASQIQQIYQAGSASLVSIALSPQNPSIAKGSTQQFTATGTLSNGAVQDLTSSVTWLSSNTKVGTITTSGLATGVGIGSTTIEATSGSISASTGLMVLSPVLTSLTVTPANARIAAGSKQQFTATGIYSDGSVQNLTNAVVWSSSNAKVAAIAAGGLATALSAGNVNIQASLGSVGGSTQLTVTPPVLVSITVTPASVGILVGNTLQYSAIGTYNDGSAQDVTSSASWSSSNTAAATVNATGLATGVAPGNTTIQALLGAIGATASLTVTVRQPVFTYMRPFTLNNPGATLTNYQVKLSLNSSNMNFAHANPDGSDIRVRASDGTTNLSYWIENWDSSSQLATIWVKVPSIPSGTSTINLMYGNASASTTASGVNTFLFFDDFSAADPSLLSGYYQESTPEPTDFGVAQPWEGSDWPHFFTVMANPFGATFDGTMYSYWGWYGLQNSTLSGIGLAGSNDLVNWYKYSGNPVIPVAIGASRPSVLLDGATLQMAYQTTDASQQVGHASSADGISWTINTPFTSYLYGGYTPAIWKNLNDNLFYLYWSSGQLGDASYAIFVRSASTVAALANASDTLVWTLPTAPPSIGANVLYAPTNVLYDAASGLYVLQFEAGPNLPDSTGTMAWGPYWDVTTLLSRNPTTGWYLAAGNPYHTGGYACPSSYNDGGTLYTYYCIFTGANWEIDYTTASIGAGLQKFGKPKTSLWTDLHDGADQAPLWYLNSCTDWKGSASTCLTGFGRYSGVNRINPMLESSFSGANYILDGYVLGMEGKDAQLGIRMGATPGSEYTTEAHYGLNGKNNFTLLQRAPGTSTSLASVPAGNLFYKRWYQVEAVANGTTQSGSIENGTYSASGTSKAYAGGSAGPSLEYFGTSIFSDLYIRQYATNPPTSTAGSETSGKF